MSVTTIARRTAHNTTNKPARKPRYAITGWTCTTTEMVGGEVVGSWVDTYKVDAGFADDIRDWADGMTASGEWKESKAAKRRQKLGCGGVYDVLLVDTEDSKHVLFCAVAAIRPTKPADAPAPGDAADKVLKGLGGKPPKAPIQKGAKAKAPKGSRIVPKLGEVYVRKTKDGKYRVAASFSKVDRPVTRSWVCTTAKVAEGLRSLIMGADSFITIEGVKTDSQGRTYADFTCGLPSTKVVTAAALRVAGDTYVASLDAA